jgi:hypothetical protein
LREKGGVMIDYSKMTDEELNEAIALKRGWKKVRILVGLSIERCLWDNGHYQHTSAPHYTHDWRLAGELLEEMRDKCLVSLMNGRLDNPSWLCSIFSNMVGISTIADTPQRAICEAWLAWKEQG